MTDNSATAEKSQEKNFDQFYTKDAIAEECLADLVNILQDNSDYDLDKVCFLEPSAGGGAFLRALDKEKYSNYYACDIDPNGKKIIKRDFLCDDLSDDLPDKQSVIVIGNPPFGRRARTAAAFINKALDYTETIAFILPLQFQKHSAQNKLARHARLIFDKTLTPDAFVFNGKSYIVRCCFQIWTTRNFGKDLRLRSSPITKHKDFDMWQYNNTREAEKYFNKDLYGWDFAIPRQGYKDYTIKETDPDKMDRRTQWIFFKAKTPEVLDRLNQINYDKLSKKNISIPGFGKADVIKEYESMFGDKPLDITNEETKLANHLQARDDSKSSTDQKNENDFNRLPLGALLDY